MKKKSTAKKFKSAKIMDDYLEKHDLSGFFKEEGVVIRPPQKKLNLDLPLTVVQQIDKIADEIGIARQPLIKMWIHEKIRETTTGL